MLNKLSIYFLFVGLLMLFACNKKLNRIAKIQTNDYTFNQGYITLKGTVIDVPENGLINYGHCISVTNKPSLLDTVYSFGETLEQKSYNSAISNLSADKTYYYTAFAITNSDTIYGEIKSFKTNDFNSISITTKIPSITGNSSVSIEGEIKGLASLTALEYGHCWSTTPNPNIFIIKNNFGILNSDITFTSNINNVPLDIRYYLKSYVKLSDNTVLYGNESNIVIPDLTVSTDTFTLPSTLNATLQGTLISLGINPISEYGHCYSTTTSNPNINNNKISIGNATATGAFFTSLNNMQPGTTYYYRAYAVTGNKIKYGKVKKIVN